MLASKFLFCPFYRAAPVTCDTLIRSLQMNQSLTPLASPQTASSSLPASKKLLRLFWASHMPRPWTLSCEHFSFILFKIIITTIIFIFCLAFWWNCQLTSHLEREFAHFHHGSFAALISTTLFAGSFFEEHITLLNELYRLFISICSSPKVVLSPWERKNRVTAAIDCYSRS